MTDQWSGAIPAYPTDPTEVARLQAAAAGQSTHTHTDPRLQAVAPPQPGQHVGYPTPLAEAPYRPTYDPSKRKTRAEILAMRRAEREAGVDFELPNTGIMARVRDLPLTDRIMLRGVPADMRQPLARAIELTAELERNSEEGSLSKAFDMLDMEQELSDVTCWAGFIWPRLARTEAERVRIMHETGLKEDEVLLLSDLHPDEKAAYRDFVFRDRNGSEEDVARVAEFQQADAQLAQAPDREAGGPQARGPQPDAGDGGERLLAGVAASA